MPNYKIKYVYDTGDSFRTERDCESVLEMSWTDLEVAKANLTRIKEHYEFYLAADKPYLLNKKELAAAKEAASKKDWFVNDKYEMNLCLTLFTDDGAPCQIHAPWCGYFERLNEAEIVEDHSDRKISFR